jgi:hypothetical protein
MSDQGADRPKQSRPLHEFLRAAMPTLDGHLASSVILTDEPPRWCGESEEDEHYYEKVQEIKNAITQQQHNRAVLKMEEFERFNRSDELDDPKTWALHTRPPLADVCE